MFGVITIYKVHTVKGYVKTVESFILNKEIINKIKPIIKNIIKTFLSNKKEVG